MKMWTAVQAGVAGLLVALVSGCDWDFGGSADSWSDRHNLINFSAVYRGVGGSRLITDYSSTAGTEGLDQMENEIIAQISNGAGTVYQGVLPHKIIAEGTVSIFGPDNLRWDDDGDGVLVGQGAALNGTINYTTGAWRVSITAPVPTGHLRAIYAWIGDGTQVGISRPGAGSEYSIFTFTVTQEGNKLTIVDNQGAVYTGRFGSVRTTTGESLDNPDSLETLEGTVIASFEAAGRSRAGMDVRMVGTFHAGANMSNRRMFGTWIEARGRTGDIVGQASPIGAQ